MLTPVKHRILVVDDDESVREVFALMLRREGYDVDTAENGFDALLKLKEVVIPDVISALPGAERRSVSLARWNVSKAKTEVLSTIA